MKINLNTYKINAKSAITQKNNSSKQNMQASESVPVSYPANYYMSFRGINLQKMYEEYNWYIYHDRVPAIQSFLKIKASQVEMDEFLTQILSTKDRSYELIDSIVSLPREGKKILCALQEKVGANSKNVMTFLYDSPYNLAYTRYIAEKFNRAKNVIELLKIRPDWSEQALIKKQCESGNGEQAIGRIPKHISQEHLDIIIPYLKKEMEFGAKHRKQIADLVLDGKTYQFLYYTEGRSSKNVFRVHIPCVMKTYIIKMDLPEKRSLDAPLSLGTLAKIDAYLTLNRSRNSAPLCYYNYKDNFSIYKYISHTKVDEPTNDLSKIKSHLPDFSELGLDYNDTVGYKNFFKLNESSIDTHEKMEGFNEALNKNEWISVDNDHVTYNNRLQPMVTGYHTSLPNAMQVCV